MTDAQLMQLLGSYCSTEDTPMTVCGATTLQYTNFARVLQQHAHL